MFAFVKSLFISSSPVKETDDDDTSSTDSLAAEDEPVLLDNSSHSSSDVEAIEETTHAHNNTHIENSSCNIQPKKDSHINNSATNDLPATINLSIQSSDTPESIFIGSLFLVDGQQFECLMPQCEAEFQKSCLIYRCKKQIKENSVPDIITQQFRMSQICQVRQHLIDAFQFVVRNAKGDSAEEYGFQLQTVSKAMVFRSCIYSALIDVSTPVLEVECAIADYDTTAKEFVILSKSATATIYRRSNDNEYYFVIRNKQSKETVNNKTYQNPTIFVQTLSKEMQIWPSPSTNQITFWGIHHQKMSITNTMFMLEIDPKSVEDSLINQFFEQFSIILQDKTFLRERHMNNSDTTTAEDNWGEPMEDDGFDIGGIGDPSVQLEWKDTRRSSGKHIDDDSSDENESDKEEDDIYQSGIYPSYSSGTNPDALVHRFMEVGSDRTFVCRGDPGSPSASYYSGNRQRDTGRLQLKVYKKEEGLGQDILESVGIIDGSKFTYKNKLFAPGQGLLHQQEKTLLVVPENDKDGNVFMMDLETETVVQKWDAEKTQISTMFPTFKKGQASMDPTFLCANPRNLFLMDTRVSNKSAKTTSYSYSTNPQLSVGATDSNGHILVGSRLGELRLYDGGANARGEFKRAKTLLQTIKEPITAVDVTTDGSWILATTKTFLVVFPTKLTGSNRTGFDTALGKQKPTARYLMLSAEDMVKYQITDLNFAPAKFDHEEDSIVTSTGNMAVVWDFGTVKRGKPFYSVRFAEDAIKDVQISADSSNVVVAYPTAVGLFGTEKRKI